MVIDMNKRFEIGNPQLPEYTRKEAISMRMGTDIVETIEDCLFYAKKELPRGDGKKLTKSKLYELILGEITCDYKTRGKESYLWNLIDVWSQD